MTGQSKPAQHKYEMQLSDSEIRARYNELKFFERAALEDSTRKCMDSVVRCYITYCRSMRIRAFPVTYPSIGLYLVQYCHKFGHTTRSIPGIISHLKRANRSYSDEWLDAASEASLDDLVKGLRKFDKSSPRRKHPMTHKVISDIQRVVNMQTLEGYQHITMSRIAHDALLRGCELVKLKIGDLVWSAEMSAVRMTIHTSKANKDGPTEYVSLRDYGPQSAVAFLREYVRIMGFAARGKRSSQPLWPVVSPDGHVNWGQATTKSSFVSLARKYLAQAGYAQQMYSGHSYRSGGATDLWASHRARGRTIQLHGRWKSDAYRLYIRDNPQDTVEEVTHALAFFSQATQDTDDTGKKGSSSTFDTHRF